MPHIIVEYLEKNLEDTQVSALLQAVHLAIADSGLFKANQIRSRAYPFKHFSNAGGNAPYIHIQARIKSGRDTDNKKQLSKVILSGIGKLKLPTSIITVEVIDMHRDSYAKLTTN
ncbi:hypothetical protein MNBD_GAMMA23-2355 [hydrothermal vent metagenome]|uniref:5-carboxymethyl-2-hydroxymuconate delta-isomerase n=1 Tax=hydrothermal vent metagenome TaxID=652676 RepID=A0A3B0ZZI4_9ZZZZ